MNFLVSMFLLFACAFSVATEVCEMSLFIFLSMLPMGHCTSFKTVVI